MKNFYILILLLVAMLFVSSCSHTNEQLLRAGQLVETAPDSAMIILQKYNYNRLSDKDKALYGLVYVRITDKIHNKIEPDSFLNFSTTYYQEHPNNELLGACYVYKARQFFYDMQFEYAMKYYLMALDQQISNSELKGKLYADVGKISMQQRDYNVARTKFLLAFENYKQANLIRQAYNVLISIGRTYTFEQKYDSSRVYYFRAIRESNDAFVAGNALQEIGIAYYYKQTYDSAKYYFEKSIRYPYIKNNLAIRYYYLAEVCFELKETLKAQNYALQSIKSDADIRTQRECYRILANCASQLNRRNDISKYMSKYQDCNDSIRKIDSQTKGSFIETMHYTQQEVSKSRSWIWYLSVIILIIVSGGIYLYIRKHNKSELVIEQSREKHIREKAEIRKDIMLKKRETLFANIDRIKEEQKKPENRVQNFALRIKNMYNELLHIQDTALFYCEMDGVLNNTVTKLKEVLPEISDKELTYCCLHLLKLPTHDILILLDYESVNSLKGMKRRLAQKLNLQNATLLNDFLLNLLSND